MVTYFIVTLPSGPVYSKKHQLKYHISLDAENGYLGIKFESAESNKLISGINVASNRLSFSLIISAIIIASSMITHTNMKPLLWGVPLLGVLGFLLASIFGMWLVFNMLRRGGI